MSHEPSPLVADTLREVPDDVLMRAMRRLGRVGNYAFLASMAMFAAGVWWDWRWFPTMLIPLGLGSASHWLGAQTRYEAKRRSTSRGAS